MIRAVPANANDSVLCSVLGQHAVHAGMAGYSGITVGKVDEQYVMLPIHAITNEPSRRVDVNGRDFTRLMSTTGQPNLSPGLGDDWALMPPFPPPQPVPSNTEPACAPIMTLAEWKGSLGGLGGPREIESLAIGHAQIKILDGFGAVQQERVLQRDDVVMPEYEIRKLECMHLSDKYPTKRLPSPLTGVLQKPFMDEQSWSTEALASSDFSERVDSRRGRPVFQSLRAGAREYIHFDPSEHGSCAVIVTSGSVCPGMNAVIREIVCTLYRYGVTNIYGIKNGFGGIVDEAMWVRLTFEDVQDIHTLGGSCLQVHSGWHSVEAGAAALRKANVKQFFALGGDGTLRGTLQLLTALTKCGHECACIGLPLTIDNNIPLVDSSLGFDTATTIARQAINAAYVEARCNANCIGLVKFTGQRSGFLALHTTLASRHVNMCLLPEMEVSPQKVMSHCENLMATQGYAVIVVADGTGNSLFRLAGETDTGKDVGYWLRDKILAHFKAKGLPLTIKYIDPTHMVKSLPPNTSDSVYCSAIGEDAVHGAMAGYTGITAVKFYNQHVYLPLSVIAEMPPRRVLPTGRWCARMIFTTKQPKFEPDGFEYPALSGDMMEALLRCSRPVATSSLLNPGSEILRLESANLAATFPSSSCPNPVLKLTGASAVSSSSWSSQCWIRRNAADTSPASFVQLLRAGQREVLHFDPKESGASAALVTCGGLCPGLNSVIREVASMLRKYGVKKIYGIKGGYKGCVLPDEWIDLTEDVIQDIHMMGGSILVSDRGNPPPEEIAKTLQSRNVRQFFVLGGDGTHAGAMETFKAMTAIKHECAVVGVPKTIDNDIQLLDRSFGFDTACTEARNAIESAYVEASTNANCIGLVKLMGRHCGWIALMASLAARTVDICLIPEMNISLPKLLDYVADVMKRKKKAVIVVAEGCGDTIIQSTGATDAGGNKLLADVGIYLKDEITNFCKSSKIPVTIKYIDPTYMIRSVPANAKDSEYSSMLGQMAVHGAMAGYTGITVGKVDESFVMLPIHAIVGKGSRKVDTSSRFFERLMATTMQPSFEP